MLYIEEKWIWKEGQYCITDDQKYEVYHGNLGYSLNEAKEVCTSALRKKKIPYATLNYSPNHHSCYLHEQCLQNNKSFVKGYYLYSQGSGKSTSNN